MQQYRISPLRETTEAKRLEIHPYEEGSFLRSEKKPKFQAIYLKKGRTHFKSLDTVYDNAMSKTQSLKISSYNEDRNASVTFDQSLPLTLKSMPISYDRPTYDKKDFEP